MTFGLVLARGVLTSSGGIALADLFEVPQEASPPFPICSSAPGAPPPLTSLGCSTTLHPQCLPLGWGSESVLQLHPPCPDNR